jgi:aryl-alcohol dehydrogenase-like predicted oxidoreductase
MTIERRSYGRDDIRLSVLGFGGIIVMKEEPAMARRVVAEAVERGINYFDVAPSYGERR